MRIDDRLNLVIPVERGDGDRVYVHSTPIGEETFERYYLVLSKLFSRMMTEGLREISGPRVAYLMLRDVALATPRTPLTNWWEGTDGVEMGLMAEVERLTNVVGPDPRGGGWATMPLRAAVAQGWLTQGELSEVMGQITFFTMASSAPPKETRTGFIRQAARLYDSLITSSNSTEYARSLRTSTPEGTSDETDTSPTQPQPEAPVREPVQRRADPVAVATGGVLQQARPRPRHR